MAYTLDQIKQYASNPSSIPTSGRYGEGQVYNIKEMLDAAKQQVLSGNLSVVDFQNLASPLVKQAQNVTQQVAGGGSKQASAVNPAWQSLQNGGYVTSRGGQWTPVLPFTQQEYAKLPDSVLPTQTDVQNGMFDPTSAPSQRYQSPQGVTNQPVTGTNPTPAIAPNGTPLPGITPSIPAGTNTQTDQGQLALQGAQNAAALQDALNKQYGVNQQAVQQLSQSLQNIPGVYTQEGQSEANQLNQLNDQQKAARASNLTALASILAQNQQNLFNRAIPDLAEQANTAGIYRSTGFGNQLAQKYGQLTQDTQTQLALQNLADQNTYLQGQSNALNTNLGWQGQAANANASGQQTVGAANAGALQAYGAGLGDVANAQIGMQNAGLQRQFNLQDYATQYSNALNLANQAKTQSSGKSPNTQAGWQTGLGAAQIGAGAMGKPGGVTSGIQSIGNGLTTNSKIRSPYQLP